MTVVLWYGTCMLICFAGRNFDQGSENRCTMTKPVSNVHVPGLYHANIIFLVKDTWYRALSLHGEAKLIIRNQRYDSIDTAHSTDIVYSTDIRTIDMLFVSRDLAEGCRQHYGDYKSHHLTHYEWRHWPKS